MCCRSNIPTHCSPMYCSIPGFPVLHHLQSLLKLMSIQSVMPSNHLILCHPLLLLPLIFPSIRVFSNESALCIRWPKYWIFSFSISSSSEYSGLISFRIDWFDLLAVQGTLESLLQHHSLKASILWHSEWPSLKTLQITNAGEDVEKRKPSYTDGRMFSWCSHCGKQYVPYKTENRIIVWSSSPIPGLMLR